MKQDLYLPESLSSIVSQLEKLNSPDAEQLKAIVSKANVSAEDLHPFRFFDHPSEQSYGRTLIHTSKNFMILSISWVPGDFSAIHSHGDTEWGVLCFYGDCEHRLYEETNNTIRLVKKSIIPKGTMVAFEGDYIHAMGNNSNKPFQTLHVYLTSNPGKVPGSGAKLFFPEKRKVYFTTGAAYLNSEFPDSVSEAGTINSDRDTLNDYTSCIRPFFERNNKTQYLDSINFD